MSKVRIILCVIFLAACQVHASERITLGIMPFLSRSSEVSDVQAAAITDVMTRTLNVSPSISIVERERLRIIAAEHGISFAQDAAQQIGSLAGCRYIMLGTVTQFSEGYYSTLKTSLFSVSERSVHQAVITLEARIIDIVTGRVILSSSKSGSAAFSSKGSSTYLVNGAVNLKEKAIDAAASRLGDKIREVLAGEYATVIKISKNNIHINRGRASGVSVGMLYRVYEEGEELFDLDGTSLGRRISNIALIRVKDVSDKFSISEILSKQTPSKKKSGPTKKADKNSGNLIRIGDRIENLSVSEADRLILASQRMTQ